MGKFNLAQQMKGVQPMDQCRREINDKELLKSRIANLGKKRQIVEKDKKKTKGLASTKTRKNSALRGAKKKTQLEALLKLKSQKGVKQEHLQLLGQLEKQLLEQNMNSADLEDTMVENNKMSGKMRKLQHKEIDSMGEEEDATEELKNITSLFLEQIQDKDNEDEDGWVTEGEEEEEEQEEEEGEKSRRLRRID